MTDSTNLGEIVSTGQRRSSPSTSFPTRTAIGSGGGESIYDEMDNGEGGPQPTPDPCSQPATKREWNADAAAAIALARMIATASAQANVTHNLSNREYGGMICEAPDGSLTISPIVWGDPIFDEQGAWVGAGSQPSAPVDINACGGLLPLAMFHSHPGSGTGSQTPSLNDSTWVASINNIRGDNLGRIYIMSNDNTGNPRVINVYNHTNVVQAMLNGVAGPYVNPDGQPCTPTAVS